MNDKNDNTNVNTNDKNDNMNYNTNDKKRQYERQCFFYIFLNIERRQEYTFIHIEDSLKESRNVCKYR